MAVAGKGTKSCTAMGVPKRYVMTALACSGILWFFALRINLSVTIVAMVTHAAKNKTINNECPADSNTTQEMHADGEFNWNSDLQGLVLSSLFYGYIFTPLAGGVLSERFGPRIVFGIGLSSMSVLTLFTAVGARTSVYLLIVIRALEGLVGGVILSAVPVIMERWAPMAERNRLVAVVLCGSHIGTVLSHIVSGVLSDTDFLGGWPSVFYVMGGCGLISGLLWLFLVTDRPEQHPSISKQELDHILSSTSQSKKHYRIPWRHIFISVPVWATIISYPCMLWGLYTMTTLLPTYMEQILNLPIRENGLLSSLPYLVSWGVVILAGVISDLLVKSLKMSTTAVQKGTFCFGGLAMAAFTIAAGHTGCDVVVNVVCFTLGVGLLSFTYPALFGNAMYLAPKYAGTIFGITNTAANIPGIVAPSVAEYIIGDEPSQERWRMVFYITGGICIFGSLVFLFFASGELQPWAGSSETEVTSPPGRKGVLNDGFVTEQDANIQHTNTGSADATAVTTITTKNVVL